MTTAVKMVDITHLPISQVELTEAVGTLFPDLIILDARYNILSIGTGILESLGSERARLGQQSLAEVFGREDFLNDLKGWLLPGYFHPKEIELTSNDVTSVFELSGFYLGLVTSVNGIILLRLKNKETDNFQMSEEMDEFVYHSAHHLRGPIATLKGLIHLLKIQPDGVDTPFLIHQMESYAQNLDDRLSRLICFAESDKESHNDEIPVTLEGIFLKLSQQLEHENTLFPIHFEHSSPTERKKVLNAPMVFSMLHYLLRFFCQCERESDNKLFWEDVSTNSNSVELVIRADGFSLAESSGQKLNNFNFGYSDILNYPELINCYAARKIAQRLRGNIRFFVLSRKQVFVSVSLPF